MKIVLTHIILIVSAIFSTAHAELNTSQAAIFDFPITTLSGDTFTLADYRGQQPVYLKFWATWCQPCRKEMPHLQHAFEKYGKQIKIIAINIGINDDVQSIQQTLLEFGLTLPVAIDSTGELSKAFNMIGTPYHVLIDRTGNIVHRGHKASEKLDRKLAMLSEQTTTDLPGAPLQSVTTQPLKLGQGSDKLSALFFMSTWCDWYLKESKPAMSANCTNAQKLVNTLYTDNPQLNWHGVATRLWTGNEELSTYKKKHHVEHPVTIDTSGDTFLQFNINKLPTLILIKNGKEIFRESDFSNSVAVTATIKQSTKQ